MINKKNMLLLTVILVGLLITGCSGISGRGNDAPVSAEFTATGTEGIVMGFIQDQPPQKVYTQSPLTFLVEIKNKGTYTALDATFTLTGFDPNIITGIDTVQTLPEKLEGKNQFNPEGGYTTLEFFTDSVSLGETMPNYKPTFMLTACYEYQTIATPLVCIDPNPLDTTSDKACRVQKVYSTGSQGAPVVVQSIESEARPSGMFFRIHVSNSGTGGETSGTVYDLAKLGSCPTGGLTYRDLNTMDYTVSLAGATLDCEPRNNALRLVNNKGVIFCRYRDIPQSSAYQTPIEVTLKYGYKNSISKVVEIENLEFSR